MGYFSTIHICVLGNLADNDAVTEENQKWVCRRTSFIALTFLVFHRCLL